LVKNIAISNSDICVGETALHLQRQAKERFKPISSVKESCTPKKTIDQQLKCANK